MGITMSPYHYFAKFLFAINAAATTVSSIRNQQAPTITYPVDFECRLDLDELTETSYQEFITDLRTKLLVGGDKSSGKVLILPTYDHPHLFDVVLTASGRQVTVRGRRDNLYVRGYSMEANKWMELREDKNDKLHMVYKDSVHLKFFGSYRDMEKEAKTGVTDIKYSKKELKKAVETLAEPANTKDTKKTATSLIFMAQMISEAARLKHISDHFASKLVFGVKVPVWMRTLQNDWGRFSRVVQCSDTYQKKYNYSTVTIDDDDYRTVDELRGIFGVMLKAKKLDEKTCEIGKKTDEGEVEAAVVLSADM